MMSDKEGEENAPREWEVVSLTASTYAAAPGPKKVELKNGDNDNSYGESEAVELKVDDSSYQYEAAEAETSRPLFMSSHFVFPPSQHENLPLEPDESQIVDENVGKYVASESGMEEGGRSSGKDEENWPLKGLDESEEFPGMPFFNEKDSRLSIPVTDLEESTTLQELNLSGKEQSIYSTTTFSTFHSETELGGSTGYGNCLSIPEVIESSDRILDFPMDASDSAKSSKTDEYDVSDVPCETWWKRRAASLYAHAKEANAFWSVFVAAAVMGLVILGQRWQQERWQVLQLKWQSCLDNEKSGKVLGPIYRLKDVIVGGNRRGSLLRGTSTGDN